MGASWKGVEFKTYEPEIPVQRKVAAYTGTSNLYNGMLASAKSIVANSDVEEVWLLTDGTPLPQEVPDIVHVMDVSRKAKLFFPDDGANMGSRYTYMAMMRAALPFLFPKQDRILSLDCDLAAVGDISGLWDLPLGDEYYLAASREPNRCTGGLLYVNVGVTLYNLKKLRDGKGMEVISALNRHQYPNLEQDAFSYLCSSRILDMPAEYNCTAFTMPVKKQDARIIHFAGEKKWLNRREIVAWHRMPWEKVLEMHEAHAAPPIP